LYKEQHDPIFYKESRTLSFHFYAVFLSVGKSAAKARGGDPDASFCIDYRW
jgi:hypothetical protein